MYICTTVGGFQSKPDLTKLKWEVKDLTTNEIVDQLKSGHSLSQNFKTSRKTGLFEQTDRTKDNFKSTQFIFMDLDSLSDDWDWGTILNSLKMQPTIAYTTFRHRLTDEKTGVYLGNRYRLLYFFNQEITSITDYQAYYDALINQTGIIDVLGGMDKKIIDSHARSGVLACHGTNSNNPDFHIINTHKFYNLSDLDLQSGNYINKEEGGESNIEYLPICSTHVSKEIINDSMTMDYDLWYHKYRTKYPYIDRIQSPEWIDNKWQWIGEDYFKLKYISVTLKDGNRRRTQLHTRTMLRRVIEPNVTPDALYFNIFIDLHKHINNDEDVITCKQLVQIVESVFKKTPETIAHDYADSIADLQEKNPKSGIILKRGTYSSTAEYIKNLSEVRKQQALAFYDPSVTLKENVEIMAANGVKISDRTLRNYLGENKHREAMNDEIVVLIDISKSLTWNSNNLKSHGRAVNWNKLKRLYEQKAQKVLN